MYRINYNNKWITLQQYCKEKNISYKGIRKKKSKEKKEYYEILGLEIRGSKYYMYEK